MKSKSKIIGAKKHWYSTEDILKYKKYNYLILKKGILNRINKNIKRSIREINQKICQSYFKPTKKFNKFIKTKFLKKYNINIHSNYNAIHLRIGDVDNQPFKKYLNKSDIYFLIRKIKKSKNIKNVLISDSQINKIEIKSTLGNKIYTDVDLPCHSRYSECMNQSMTDMMVMKNAKSLILTRGSTFSLFGSYFSHCNYEDIMFIGHDYEHFNYYR